MRISVSSNRNLTEMKKFIKKAPRNIPVKPILKFCVLNPQINNDILYTIPIDKQNLLFLWQKQKIEKHWRLGRNELSCIALHCIVPWDLTSKQYSLYLPVQPWNENNFLQIFKNFLQNFLQQLCHNFWYKTMPRCIAVI